MNIISIGSIAISLIAITYFIFLYFKKSPKNHQNIEVKKKIFKENYKDNYEKKYGNQSNIDNNPKKLFG